MRGRVRLIHGIGSLLRLLFEESQSFKLCHCPAKERRAKCRSLKAKKKPRGLNGAESSGNNSHRGASPQRCDKGDRLDISQWWQLELSEGASRTVLAECHEVAIKIQ